MFGVDGGIGLKIVESAIGAPGPGTQRAPLIGRAGLAFVHEADNPPGKAFGIVGLHAGRVKADESPTGRHELPFIWRIAIGVHLRSLKEGRLAEWLPCRMFGKNVLERRVLLN